MIIVIAKMGTEMAIIKVTKMAENRDKKTAVNTVVKRYFRKFLPLTTILAGPNNIQIDTTEDIRKDS